MATRRFGTLMPSRLPADDAVTKFPVEIRGNTRRGFEFGEFLELTPRLLRMTLDQASVYGHIGDLYQIYESMEYKETRYGALVKQLKDAISGLNIKIEPAEGATSEERKIAESYAFDMNEVLMNLDVESLVRSFVDPYLYSTRMYQMKWEMQNGAFGRKMWFPMDIEPVEGRYLHMDRDTTSDNYGELRVFTAADDANGTPLKDLHYSSYLLIEDGSTRNRYHKMGVARKILPWFMGIVYIQTWWIQFIEGYGAPYRIGRYARGADRNDKANMERFLRVLGKNGYALFPNDMEFQLIESNRQGTITTYSDFIQKGHDEMAILLLGQAATTGDGKEGSFARDVVSKSIRQEVLVHLAKLVAKGFTQLSDKVIRINYGENYCKSLLPKISPVIITPSDATSKLALVEKSQQMGVAVPAEHVYDQILGVEPPKDGEKAILYGTTYVVGEEEEPMSPADRAEKQHQENMKMQKESKKEEKKTERSTDDIGKRSKANTSKPNNSRGE